MRCVGYADLCVRDQAGEQLADVLAPAVHSRRALGASCREDETPDERWSDQHDFLRDEPTDREPEQVDPLDAERADKMRSSGAPSRE